MKTNYFDQWDTIEFLDDLLTNNGGPDKVSVFFDNASIHVVSDVSDYIKSKRLKAIRNIPYCPEFNGIEVLWAKLKYEFRKRLTQLKLDGDKFNVK